MKIRAIITVTGKMTGSDGQDEKVELVAEGLVFEKEGKTYISYDESALTGMEGTKTLIKLTPGKVEMSRTGSLKTKMIFEEGKQSISYYDTQYGGFTVDINTLKARVSTDEKQIDIHILYEMNFNGASNGQNDVTVNVQKLVDE